MLNLKTMGVMALVLGLSVVAVEAAVVYRLEEIDNGMAGWTTTDVYINVTGEPTWDWMLSSVTVQIAGGTYFVEPTARVFATEPKNAFLPPSVFALPGLPAWEFSTFVGAPHMVNVGGYTLPSTPGISAYAEDPATGYLQLDFFDTPAHDPSTEFVALRLTYTEGAGGTILAKTSYDNTPTDIGGRTDGPETSIPLGDAPIWQGPPATDIIDGTFGDDGIQEADWNIPQNNDHGRWNNPNRMIILTFPVADPPISGYKFDFGGGLIKDAVELPSGDFQATVTVAELFGAGWEDNDWPQGFTGMVDILMTQPSGATDNGAMGVFIPEPGTMALLGLGCLATLLRRRRR